MNALLPWRDPVVAEIHAIRDELEREFGGDLAAYSDAAAAHCQLLNLQFSVRPSTPALHNKSPIDRPGNF